MHGAHEAADGALYRVHSAVLLLMAQFDFKPVQAMVGLSNHLRVYPADIAGSGTNSSTATVSLEY